MARDITPKFKRSRREKIDLHPDLDKAGTAKSPLVRKQYAPGMHGPKSTWTKMSIYGKQLREKQKTKRIYGILERQFSNYYRKALRQTGDTGEVMLSLLERRLDNVVYRLGLAKTRPAARQLVTHRHVFVNGKACNIPSRTISVGDEISVRESSAKKVLFSEDAQKAIDRTIPGWLSKGHLGGKVVSMPELDEPKMLVDMRQIVEFYSK